MRLNRDYILIGGSMKLDSNFRRNRLAEQLLCALLSNEGYLRDMAGAGGGIKAVAGRVVREAFEYADVFLETFKPVGEEAASVEVDEFDDSSLVIDADEVLS